MGRPSKFDKEIHCDWAWLLATQGLTDAEIAQKMGISKSTLNKWKSDYPEFSDSLKNGKESADAKVVHSLYVRAIGYEYVERKKIMKIGKDGKPTLDHMEVIEKTIPGDVGAQAFWLKNRDPNNWRDKRDVEVAAEIKPIAYDMTVWAEEMDNAINGVSTKAESTGDSETN